tara:strand:- start:322 stop:450 length:129 start_codon:yes stop_codon:yes gene_type:complete
MWHLAKISASLGPTPAMFVVGSDRIKSRFQNRKKEYEKHDIK